VRTTKAAPVKVGRRSLTTVAAGTELRAVAVKGKWVKVRVRADGKTITGWIYAPKYLEAASPQAADPGESKSVTVDLGGGVTMEFVPIRPGSFTMGDVRGLADEKAVHKVTLTKPFYMGKYEVTQEQWQAIMGKNPLRKDLRGPKKPVGDVSWSECQEFVAKINEKLSGKKVRLPTEAEWEYACRAGTTTRYSYGDKHDYLGRYAWFSGNASSLPRPVGGKKPNPWGLYDMHGNVWEWCEDWYGMYTQDEQADPKGQPTGRHRIVRGGSAQLDTGFLTSSRRYAYPPNYRERWLGLRLVLVTGPE